MTAIIYAASPKNYEHGIAEAAQLADDIVSTFEQDDVVYNLSPPAIPAA